MTSQYATTANQSAIFGNSLPNQKLDRKGLYPIEGQIGQKINSYSANGAISPDGSIVQLDGAVALGAAGALSVDCTNLNFVGREITFVRTDNSVAAPAHVVTFNGNAAAGHSTITWGAQDNFASATVKFIIANGVAEPVVTGTNGNITVA